MIFWTTCQGSNTQSKDADVMPQTYQMLVLLCVFLVVVNYHGRLVEVTSRLDFLWKQEAEKELQDMTETRQNNSQLLRNILPDHVANHFLAQDRQTEVGEPEGGVLGGGTKGNINFLVVFSGIIFAAEE